jgi:D-xylose transport system substrate-binding protein
VNSARISRLMWFVISALMCVPFFAQAQEKTAGKPVKIGISIDSLSVERWQTDLQAFQKRGDELGAEVVASTPEGDDDLQYEQVKKMIDSGIQSLVLVPHDTTLGARIVSMAKARHVPVISYDRLVRNGDVDLFIGFDGDAIGAMQAAFLVKHAPKGNYVLLGGSPTDGNSQILREAQVKVLKPLIERGDIRIVGDTWTQDWKPSIAYTNMLEIIDSTKGDFVAVVAPNDGTAGGAIEALGEHQLAGKVFVSGQDAELSAIARILEGTQTMTVYKPVAIEAREAADAAVRLARHEPVHTKTTVPNGRKDVPAILLKPVAVTKDNVKDTVIKDGFQKVEEIKRVLSKDKWSLIE